MRLKILVGAITAALVLGTAQPAVAVDHEDDFFQHLLDRVSCLINAPFAGDPFLVGSAVKTCVKGG